MYNNYSMISAEIICFFLLYFGNVKKQDILSINHEIQGEIANKSATHSRKEHPNSSLAVQSADF